MQMNYKKVLKIATLLLSSLLIATVSAQAYRFMYIDGSVSISVTGLKWVKGDSASGGTSISGSTATVAMSISNGTIANFTHYLYLQNQDGTGHSLMINITNDATSSLYETNGFNMTIYNNATGVYISALDVLSTSSYYSGTISGSAVWQVTFEIATKTDASGSDGFNVQFRYE